MKVELYHSSLAAAKGDHEVKFLEQFAEVDESTVHQVLVAYQSTGRQSSPLGKSRSAVAGSGKKRWRQKGTGRARCSDGKSPNWRGGGRSFGGAVKNFVKKINKKMWKSTLGHILYAKCQKGQFCAIDAWNYEVAKTKEAAAKLCIASGNKQRTLLITSQYQSEFKLATRNIPNVEYIDVAAMNPLNLLKSEKIIADIDTIKKIEEYFNG